MDRKREADVGLGFFGRKDGRKEGRKEGRKGDTF